MYGLLVTTLTLLWSVDLLNWDGERSTDTELSVPFRCRAPCSAGLRAAVLGVRVSGALPVHHAVARRQLGQELVTSQNPTRDRDKARPICLRASSKAVFANAPFFYFSRFHGVFQCFNQAPAVLVGRICQYCRNEHPPLAT